MLRCAAENKLDILLAELAKNAELFSFVAVAMEENKNISQKSKACHEFIEGLKVGEGECPFQTGCVH